ncbi:MAG: amidohydrolase family protein [Steroidobacteraceae bacterium]
MVLTPHAMSLARRRFMQGLGAAGIAAASSALPFARAQNRGTAWRIDVHHHFVPPLFRQVASTHGLLNHYLTGMSLVRSLEAMDRNEVATTVLSIPAPGVWYGKVNLARQIARDANDFAATAAREHRGRFAMFATLPLPDVEGSLAEVAYACDHLHAEGIHMWTNYGDFWIGDPRLTPLLEELNRRRAVVFVHPRTPQCCANLLPQVPDQIIEYGTDTTRAIASLVFSGAAHAFPAIRWIFCHAGGTMPFLIGRFQYLGRVQGRTAEGASKIPHGVMYELKRLYFDTAQSANPYALGPLKRLVDTSHILLGTDFPYRTVGGDVRGLASCGLFAPGDLQMIERDNALRLMPELAQVASRRHEQRE